MDIYLSSFGVAREKRRRGGGHGKSCFEPALSLKSRQNPKILGHHGHIIL